LLTHGKRRDETVIFALHMAAIYSMPGQPDEPFATTGVSNQNDCPRRT
jgi:hypothetical protein